MKCSILVKRHLIYEEKNQHNPPNSLLDIFDFIHPDTCISNEEHVLNKRWGVSRFLTSKNINRKNINTKTLNVLTSTERWQSIKATNANPLLLKYGEKVIIHINCLQVKFQKAEVHSSSKNYQDLKNNWKLATSTCPGVFHLKNVTACYFALPCDAWYDTRLQIQQVSGLPHWLITWLVFLTSQIFFYWG